MRQDDKDFYFILGYISAVSSCECDECSVDLKEIRDTLEKAKHISAPNSEVDR
jgi:hypothetical protein